jgi:hypothetical protein
MQIGHLDYCAFRQSPSRLSIKSHTITAQAMKREKNIDKKGRKENQKSNAGWTCLIKRISKVNLPLA